MPVLVGAPKKLLQAAEARRRYRSARPRTTGPCIEEVSRVKVGRWGREREDERRTRQNCPSWTTKTQPGG